MLISIITATYNSETTVGDTLTSVSSQSYFDIEHIIIDGKSQDDTLSLVKQFPHVQKVVSEKDNGIYDAMNKGIQRATGEVIGILNSDDYFSNNEVLQKVAEKFEQSDIDVVYGDLQYVDALNTSKIIRTWKSGSFNERSFFRGWMPPHPTFFVRKSVYERVGNFNTTLKSSADYELMLRVLLKYQLKAAYIPEILVKMRTGGLSNASLRNRLRANREDRLAWKINGLKPQFFTLYLKPLRKIFQYF